MAAIATAKVASDAAPFHPKINRVWEALPIHLLVMLQEQYPLNIGYYDNGYTETAEYWHADDDCDDAQEQTENVAYTDDICDDNQEQTEENVVHTEDICDDNQEPFEENVAYADDTCGDNYARSTSDCPSEGVKDELWQIAKSLPTDLEMFFQVRREDREGMIRNYFTSNWGIETDIRDVLTEEAINCFIDNCELLRAIFLYGEDGSAPTCLALDADTRINLANQGRPDREHHIIELTRTALPDTQSDASASWPSYFRTLLLVTYDDEEGGEQNASALIPGAINVRDLSEAALIQVSMAMWFITIESLFDLDAWVVKQGEVVDEDGLVGWQKELLANVTVFHHDLNPEEHEFSVLPFRRAKKEYTVSEDFVAAAFAVIQAYNKSLREQYPMEMPQAPEEVDADPALLSEGVDADPAIVEEAEPADELTQMLAKLAALHPEL